MQTYRRLASVSVLPVMLLCVFVCTEEDFLLTQAALLEQVSTLQPLLDSNYIRGEFNLKDTEQSTENTTSACHCLLSSVSGHVTYDTMVL